ncbi:unnamed protein product [Ixodes hexagonus]
MSLALPQTQAQPPLGGPNNHGGAPPTTTPLEEGEPLLAGVADARSPSRSLEVASAVPQVVVVPPPLRPREHKPHASSAHHHGYANCFGLPYQAIQGQETFPDHNYGAPPPPTPPQSPPPPPAPQPPVHRVNGSPPPSALPNGCLEESKGEEPGTSPTEESVTRCICGFNHDDEYMICCDHCSVWQHVDCMGLDRSRIPETYLCERCHPRRVDRHRARSLQARKKQQMSRALSRLESTSDESGGGGIRRPPRGSRPRYAFFSGPLEPLVGRKMMKERIERKKVKLKNMVSAAGSPKTRFLGLAQVPAKVTIFTAGDAIEEEAAQDAWGPGVSPSGGGTSPGDRYETALINQYTPEVQLMAGSLKLNGQHDALVCKVSTSHGDPPWQVEACGGGQRRLVAAYALGPQQPLLEVRGKFLSASQFRHQNPVFHKRLYPFVLFYQPCAEEETVCVDAREYGNEARFVRRSCSPNVEVQHVVQNGLLHLYLVSSRDIAPGQELTIPFDFDYRQCIHSVSCACGSEDCRVASKGRKAAPPVERKRRGRRVSTGSCGIADEEAAPVKEVARQTPHHDEQPSLGTLAEPQECSPVMQSPASDSATGQDGHAGNAEDGEGEEQSSAERRRKMTREERKIDAIMRAFEKMERTEKRRQQALERMAQQHRGPKHETPQAPLDKLEDERSNDSSLLAVLPEDIKTELHPEGSTEDRTVPTHRARKGKRRRSTLSRRRSRTVSGGSELLGSPLECEASPEAPPTSVVAPPPPLAIQQPLSPPCHQEEEPLTAEGANTPPQGPVRSPGTSPCHAAKAFALPKSKRFLMQGWLHEKACGDVSEGGPGHPGLAPSSAHPVEEAPCYVRCTRDPAPSAVGISAAHLRRNSCSTSAPTSGGSAKKRWLRQAMFESSEEVTDDGAPDGGGGAECPGSPSQGGEDSCQSASSPPPSSGDLVTPLKKRRLVRESRESLDSMTGGLSPATGEAAATLLLFQTPSMVITSCFSVGMHTGVHCPNLQIRHILANPRGMFCTQPEAPEECGEQSPLVAPPEAPPEEDDDPPTPLDDEESLVDCDEAGLLDAETDIVFAGIDIADAAAGGGTDIVLTGIDIADAGAGVSGNRADAAWSALRPDAVDVSDCSTASSSSSSVCALPPSSPGSRPVPSGGMLKRKVGAEQSEHSHASAVTVRGWRLQVSLSEYRMRMRETGKAAGAPGGCKNPLGPPGLPLQDGARHCNPLCSPAKGKHSDSSFARLATGDDPWALPRRERLSQRLRREFGLDDDSDTERNPEGAPAVPACTTAGYPPNLVPPLVPPLPPGAPGVTPGPVRGTTPPQGRPPQGYFHS